jgi:hypothetical protein
LYIEFCILYLFIIAIIFFNILYITLIIPTFLSLNILIFPLPFLIIKFPLFIFLNNNNFIVVSLVVVIIFVNFYNIFIPLEWLIKDANQNWGEITSFYGS